MSKVTIKDLKLTGSVSLSSIPQGTFFTGKNKCSQDTHFFKAYKNVVSIPSGDRWEGDDAMFENFCECNVDINFNVVQ